MNPIIVGIVTFIHIVVCLFLIFVVLMQGGKSADIAATFGGAGSQTVFGPRGTASALSKATTWAAVMFMLTSFTLAVFTIRNQGTGGSVLGNQKAAPTKSAPATPGTPNQK